ncbi:hypothetical protein AB0948_30480 [Streptomyces koyangensis]|uniref:hypothetical protein n=1 Tax=Streptomyces koyangensis TaxID=188770 RepID=UPI003452175B
MGPFWGSPVGVREFPDDRRRPGRWHSDRPEPAGSLCEETDRIILKLAPLTAGTGVPLFGAGTAFAPRHRELTGHTVLKAGFAHLTYDRKEKEA